MGNISEILSDINEGVNSNTGEVLTIVFGITSGLLTMVGLVAIFTSLITQQVVEKLRSEWWLLRELSDEAEQLLVDIEQAHFDKKYLKELSLRLNRSLWNYETVYNEKSFFITAVITVSLITLGFVMFLWIYAMRYFSMGNLAASDFNLSLVSTIIGCALLFIFGVFLFTLIIHKKISKFPKPSDFYDATKIELHNTNTVLFACLSVRLITYDPIENGENKGKNEIFLDFQLPWKGINIYYKVNPEPAELLEMYFSKQGKGGLMFNEFVASPKDFIVITKEDGTEYSLN